MPLGKKKKRKRSFQSIILENMPIFETSPTERQIKQLTLNSAKNFPRISKCSLLNVLLMTLTGKTGEVWSRTVTRAHLSCISGPWELQHCWPLGNTLCLTRGWGFLLNNPPPKLLVGALLRSGKYPRSLIQFLNWMTAHTQVGIPGFCCEVIWPWKEHFYLKIQKKEFSGSLSTVETAPQLSTLKHAFSPTPEAPPRFLKTASFTCCLCAQHHEVQQHPKLRDQAHKGSIPGPWPLPLTSPGLKRWTTF